MVPSSIEKIFEIDRHIGCACSGLTADARMLVEHARVEAQVLDSFNRINIIPLFSITRLSMMRSCELRA